MKKLYTFIILATLSITTVHAQVIISGEVRPRTELYNGNNNAKPASDNVPGIATQQRTRLTFTYTGKDETDGLKVVFSPQLVAFWGQMPQAYDLLGDGAPGAPEANLSVFEAYAQYKVSDLFSLKFGRQAISYGDERWFGALGWAASGRAHDAFVGKFSLSEASKLDVGFSLNQTRHTNDPNTSLQAVRAGNKSIQYAWFETKLGKEGNLPIMITNITNQDLDSTGQFDGTHTHITTLGAMPKIKLSDNLTLDASAYYQFSGDDHTASLFAISATYKAGKTPITIGTDIVSGKAADDTEDKSKTWLQPFGTNHKFYGFMDFFYVGETRTEGLNDFFAKAAFKTGEKSKILAHAHYFMANKDFTSAEDGALTKSIGTEIDLIYNLNIAKPFNLKLGYSQFFASDAFGVIPSDDFNNWVWLQLSAKF